MQALVAERNRQVTVETIAIDRKIYVVEGQPPFGPGRYFAAHVTRRAAVRTAADWTNEFLKRQKRVASATPRNWRFFYPRQPLVWITETVLNA